MEDVLDVYQRPYDPKRPQVCLDEASRQLLSDVRAPLPIQPSQVERFDNEYVRGGVANLFMLFEPLAGRRHIAVTDRRTSVDFAHVVKDLVDEQYPDAEVIVVVMDNLNTHTPASLYEAFAPAEAKRLADKLEIHYTPRHGSWLNMAEIELSVLSRQCLSERMRDKNRLVEQVVAWEAERNARRMRVDWRFTTADARIKLRRLYPTTLP
jgi:hypothetical protein